MNEQEFMQWIGECDKLEFQEAMTRKDYNDFFKKGLRGALIDSYTKAAKKTTYQELVTVEPSDSDKEEYPVIGDPENPTLVMEGERYQQGNPGAPDLITVTNFKHGMLIELTDEAAADDKSPGKQLAKQATKIGPKHATFKNKVFYSIILANGTIYDGNAFFSANHPFYTGSAAGANNDNAYSGVTLSVNALAVAISMVSLWEGGNSDQELDIEVEKIVVPKRLLPAATALVRMASVPIAYAAGVMGPTTVAGGGQAPWQVRDLGLKIVTDGRLDRTSTVNWYLWTNMAGLIYQPREGLTVVQEAPNSGEGFERGVLRWRSSERFGRKVGNWRCGMIVA